VEFNVFRGGSIIRRGQFVELSTEPVDLRLKDADATENKVRFCGVAGRARIVKIQKVHKKCSRVGFHPADRVGSPLNRN